MRLTEEEENTLRVLDFFNSSLDFNLQIQKNAFKSIIRDFLYNRVVVDVGVGI